MRKTREQVLGISIGNIDHEKTVLIAFFAGIEHEHLADDLALRGQQGCLSRLARFETLDIGRQKIVQEMGSILPRHDQQSTLGHGDETGGGCHLACLPLRGQIRGNRRVSKGDPHGQPV